MIDLPLRTWVKKSIPGTNNPLGASKHVRWGYCPDDGLIYMNGGDYSGPANPLYNLQSGRNEMWRLDIAAGTIKQIQNFCRTDGGVQPSGPDECGWVWDSTRKLFWHIPGYQWNPRGCNPATEIGGRIMSFDPTKTEKPWTNIGARYPATDISWSSYDPVRDVIYSLCKPSNGGALVTTKVSLDPPGTTHTLSYCKLASGAITSLTVGDAVSAFDPVSRRIFGINANHPFMWALNVDTKQFLVDFSPLPSLTAQVENMTVWDSVNGVLYWLDRLSGDVIRLRVFTPETKTWEVIPNSATVVPRGRHCVFDPGNNCLAVGGHLGGVEPNTIYLYRHGASTLPPPDTTPPDRPNRPRLISVQQ